MTDRPILFSGPMVRALLAGTKTQTRRPINPQPRIRPELVEPASGDRPTYWAVFNGDEEAHTVPIQIATGDRLYVREHWRTDLGWEGTPPRDIPAGQPIEYQAGGFSDLTGVTVHFGGNWRRGMHMPRWASRLTLTVTDVRVERLQNISEADAVAEGIEYELTTSAGRFYRNYENPPCPILPYGSYRSLWEHINGPGSWDENPWVAAYTFTVHRGNIDQVAP